MQKQEVAAAGAVTPAALPIVIHRWKENYSGYQSLAFSAPRSMIT